MALLYPHLARALALPPAPANTLRAERAPASAFAEVQEG